MSELQKSETFNYQPYLLPVSCHIHTVLL